MEAAESPEYSDSSLYAPVMIDPVTDLMLLTRIPDNGTDGVVISCGIPGVFGGVENGLSVSARLATLGVMDFASARCGREVDTDSVLVAVRESAHARRRARV